MDLKNPWRLMRKTAQIWSLVVLVLLELFATPLLAGPAPRTSKTPSTNRKYGYTQFGEQDPRYWYGMAADELRERLTILKPIHKRAKNVVFFLGDGMGISTITAARIMKGQIGGHRGEEGYLEFDRFPHSALIKTYNLDKQVPDSAGTATAYLTGVKANFITIGVSARVNQYTLDCELVNKSSVSSILHWGLDAGKAAGVVTTTRITHATPAAGYAHVPDRDWEGSVPSAVQNKAGCKDIARQLVEDYPGNRLSVILGGGRREFLPKGQYDPKGTLRRGQLIPVEGNRKDGRNIIEEWRERKAKMQLAESEFAFVNNSAGLKNIDYDKVKYLFGLFNHTHMEYEQLRDKGTNGEPSLTEMTEAAIKVLTKQGGDEGFVLLVEGGRIDHAHHDGYATMALYETVEFDRAIRRARELLPMEDTLFVVTADHSHAMTINGYPLRGNPINGYAGEDSDHIPFTTLMYANGPGFMTQEERSKKVIEDYHYNKYMVHAGIHTEDTNHAGEDVAVFSIGPMAHLFGGTHEQSHIAHIVGFAACMGVYHSEAHCAKPDAKRSGTGLTPEVEREWEESSNEVVVMKPTTPGEDRDPAARSRSLRLTNAKMIKNSAAGSKNPSGAWILASLMAGWSLLWILNHRSD